MLRYDRRIEVQPPMLVGIAGTQSDYQALFDTGFTFAVTDNLIFDTGVRIGLNDAAEDFGVFTGMSIRF